MKELSRRDFLKGALAGTAAAALTTVTGLHPRHLFRLCQGHRQ